MCQNNDKSKVLRGESRRLYHRSLQSEQGDCQDSSSKIGAWSNRHISVNLGSILRTAFW